MNEILKLKPNVATAIFACLTVFVSAVFSIFLLNRNLFNALNLWQIIAVGLGISAPALLLTVFLSLVTEKPPKTPRTEEEKHNRFWIGHLLGCSVLSY